MAEVLPQNIEQAIQAENPWYGLIRNDIFHKDATPQQHEKTDPSFFLREIIKIEDI